MLCSVFMWLACHFLSASLRISNCFLGYFVFSGPSEGPSSQGEVGAALRESLGKQCPVSATGGSHPRDILVLLYAREQAQSGRNSCIP